MHRQRLAAAGPPRLSPGRAKSPSAGAGLLCWAHEDAGRQQARGRTGRPRLGACLAQARARGPAVDALHHAIVLVLRAAGHGGLGGGAHDGENLVHLVALVLACRPTGTQGGQQGGGGGGDAQRRRRTAAQVPHAGWQARRRAQGLMGRDGRAGHHGSMPEEVPVRGPLGRRRPPGKSGLPVSSSNMMQPALHMSISVPYFSAPRNSSGGLRRRQGGDGRHTAVGSGWVPTQAGVQPRWARSPACAAVGLGPEALPVSLCGRPDLHAQA